MRYIINLTGKELSFLSSKDEKEYRVPPYEYELYISPTIRNVVDRHFLGCKIIKREVVVPFVYEHMVSELEIRYPKAIIVGTNNMVMFFPGRVFGLIPVKEDLELYKDNEFYSA